MTKTSCPLQTSATASLWNQPLERIRSLARMLRFSSTAVAERRAMEKNSRSQATLLALADYLGANPYACDTSEGILRWWLDERHETVMDELMEALGQMKRAGIVEEIVAADGRRRYRRIAGDGQLAALLAALRGDA
jgi:hypothetical protein